MKLGIENDDERPERGFEPPSSAMGSVASAIGARNLIIIIITMPLVFLLAVMATLAIFGSPGDDAPATVAVSEPREQLQEPAGDQYRGVVVASEAAFDGAPAPIALRPDQTAGAMALDGDRLAIQATGPDGAIVIVYDLAAGRELMRIPLVQGGTE